MIERHQTAYLLLGMTLLWAPAGRAEPPDKASVEEVDNSLGAGKVPAAATVERIMDQAVRNIAARYNLNDVQTAETSTIMKRRVQRFLKEHENEVWPVIRDLLASQLKQPDDIKDMMRIGKTAGPLARAAHDAILKGNEEWRLLLTAQQKEMHDFDLAEIGTTFEQIDQTLSDWQEGTPTDKGIFPQPQLAGREPSRPARPPQGKLPPPEVEVFDPNKIFETLVQEFIKEWDLNEGQITAARSILEEFKGKANDFRESKKAAFAQLATQQREAMERRDLDGIKKTRAANKKLLGPVFGLCTEMEGRLRNLLTTAQIERHAEKPDVAKDRPEKRKVTKKPSPKTEGAKAKSANSDSKAESDKG